MKNIFAFLLMLSSQALAKEIITLGNTLKVVEMPEACLKTTETCIIKTSREEKFKFKFGKSQIVLDENTALVRVSDKQVTLVSGQIWIRAQGEVIVQTQYGSVSSEIGNFLVRNKDKRMEIKAIDADLVLVSKMNQSTLKLEAGEQNWLGPIDQNKMASSGVPLPIRPSELVMSWSRLYTGTKIEFEKDFRSFFVLWSSSNERLAKLHAEITSHQIASVEEEIASKKRVKEEQAREDRRIKEWFRRRELSE